MYLRWLNDDDCGGGIKAQENCVPNLWFHAVKKVKLLGDESVPPQGFIRMVPW